MVENRRKDKRFEARWKVAMVFNASEKKPIFHTLTHDLSINGTSVQSATDEKQNTVINLLLIPPAIDGVQQKVVKLRGVVASSRPFRNGFRLGFNFVHDAELEKLWLILNGLDLTGDALPSDPAVGDAAGHVPARAPAPANTPAPPTAQPPRPATVVPPATPAATAGPASAAAPAAPATQGSVLDMIKQRALDKKKAEEQQNTSQEEQQQMRFQRISDTLMDAYKYLTDLVANLNELKPPYAGSYVLLNVPEINELSWKEGARTDCIARPSTTGVKVFHQLSLSYTLVNPTPLSFTRDLIAAEKTLQALKENSIEFSEGRVRNAQGAPTGITFSVPREIRVRLHITCDDATGKLRLETRNLERFGTMQYEFELDALNHALLDQLALMMLGERNTVGKMIRRVF